MTDLSICIPNYNTGELLEGCLRSIYANTNGLDFEVIVVDNASQDESVKLIREKFPQVILIQNETNEKFSRANNQAFEVSKSRYILMLNSDTVIVKDALAQMISYLENNPKAGAVAAKLLNLDGTVQKGFNVRAFPTIASTIAQIFLLHRIYPRSKIIRKSWMLDWEHNDKREIEQPAASCLMIRREVVDRIGGLDEKLPLYYNDVDFCLRMKRAGYKIHYLPTANVYHHWGQGARAFTKKDITLEHYKSLLYYFKKHHGWHASIIVRFFLVLGMLFRMLTLLFVKSKVDVKFLDLRKQRKEGFLAYLAVIRYCLLGK